MKSHLLLCLLLGLTNTNALHIRMLQRDSDEDKALAAIGAAINAET